MRKTLRWIICAKYSLSIKALLEALSINVDTVLLDAESKPSLRTILKYCGSLVRRSINKENLELAHFTVEEFLCAKGPLHSSQNKGYTDITQYHVNPFLVDLELATTCLVYLNLKDFDRPLNKRDQWQTFQTQYPFYEYASIRWFRHARAHFEDSTISGHMKILFAPLKSRNFNL